MTQVAVAAGLVVVAIVLSRVRRIGLESQLAIAAVRAAVQLAAVGAVVTVVFEHAGLAAAFVAVMLGVATITAGGRLRGVPRPAMRAGAAIAAGAGCGVAPLLRQRRVLTEPRELIPVAGILIGGAMAATSLTGRRMVEAVGDELAVIEARLALGAPRRRRWRAGRPPRGDHRADPGDRPDEERRAGVAAGTFVGLVLGGAHPAEAARLQLTVLLALLGVEVMAALAWPSSSVAGVTRPGERVVAA